MLDSNLFLKRQLESLDEYFSDEFNFSWADIGSNKFVDYNQQQLLYLKGKSACFDGRTFDGLYGESFYSQHNTKLASNTEIIELAPFLDVRRNDVASTEYESAFNSLPSHRQIIPISKPLDPYVDKLNNAPYPARIEYVTVDKLSLAFKSLDFYPLLFVLDVKGAEIEILEDLFLYGASTDSPVSKPLAIEVEMYVGKRNQILGIDEQIGFLRRNNYRLLDIRKTYKLPDSGLLDQSSIITNPATFPLQYCPELQGIIHQIDGLFIDESFLVDTRINRNLGLSLAIVLLLYRQFHLAYNLIERLDASDSFKLQIFHKFESVLNCYNQINKSNPFAILGGQPLFNYLKNY